MKLPKNARATGSPWRPAQGSRKTGLWGGFDTRSAASFLGGEVYRAVSVGRLGEDEACRAIARRLRSNKRTDVDGNFISDVGSRNHETIDQSSRTGLVTACHPSLAPGVVGDLAELHHMAGASLRADGVTAQNQIGLGQPGQRRYRELEEGTTVVAATVGLHREVRCGSVIR